MEEGDAGKLEAVLPATRSCPCGRPASLVRLGRGEVPFWVHLDRESVNRCAAATPPWHSLPTIMIQPDVERRIHRLLSRIGKTREGVTVALKADGTPKLFGEQNIE